MVSTYSSIAKLRRHLRDIAEIAVETAELGEGSDASSSDQEPLTGDTEPETSNDAPADEAATMESEDPAHHHVDEIFSTTPEEDPMSDERDTVSAQSIDIPGIAMPVVASEPVSHHEDAAEKDAHNHDETENDAVGAELNDSAITQQDATALTALAAESDMVMSGANREENDDASLVEAPEPEPECELGIDEVTKGESATQSRPTNSVVEDVGPTHDCGEDAGASEPHPEPTVAEIADAPKQPTPGMFQLLQPRIRISFPIVTPIAL
jgi:hypothetical protein